MWLGDYDTNFVRQHKDELWPTPTRKAEPLRLSRLVAEISARGYNPYVSLGEYRGRADKRLGRFQLSMPRRN